MSMISRLPESTTRLLSSPLVVTTPDSLVKELLDNSIDAKATFVEVIVSADTVKKIEVRDNGVGIHPDDYDSLGRHGHTSKLRSFEELSTQCSKTLGFRGEALASANSLAQVTITTKAASEPVAAVLHIIPGNGGISKQQPASAPAGTTVSITGLYDRLPVREKLAIKDSAKTIDRIRELLRSYAMARPNLRLSFKVIQSAKQSWNYSPKPDAGVREAAIQLFGAEFASHYFEKALQISRPASEGNSPLKHQKSPPNDQYIFEAFILKPDSYPSKGSEQRYFSVDGRPISAKKGTMKKILNIYVEHLGAAFQQDASGIVPKDCFIRLNIKCPPGSYDANVEPCKDGLIFLDEMEVLDGFKDLCREVYKIPILNDPGSQLPLRRSAVLDDGDTEIREQPSVMLRTKPNSKVAGCPDLSPDTRSLALPQLRHTVQHRDQHAPDKDIHLSAPRQDLDHPTSSPVLTGLAVINASIPTTQHKYPTTEVSSPGDVPPKADYTRYKVDMSRDFNEYSHDYSHKKLPRSTQVVPSLEKESGDSRYSAPPDMNPWIIAKMNAPNRDLEGRVMGDPVRRGISALPTVERCMTPDPPILRHTEAAPRDLDVPPSQRYLQLQGNAPRGVPGGVYRSPMSSSPRSIAQKDMGTATASAPLRPQRRRNLLPWSPPSSIEKPILSSKDLANNEPQQASDDLHQTTISFNGGKANRKRRVPEESGQTDHMNDQVPYAENGLQQTFTPAGENLAHQVIQKKPRQATVYPTANQAQLYTQLRVGHVQDGIGLSKVKEPIKTSLPSCDPRAYLLRRQKSIAAEAKGAGPKKIRRLKSSLLPFENVPTDGQTHFLVLIEVLTTNVLRTLVKQGASHDKYVEKGAIEDGFSLNLEEGRRVEERLKSHVRDQQGDTGNEGAKLDIGLCSLLKGKGTMVGT
ncbi:hypothetical protein GGS26DRAFT_586667 [Hypomontagnella submonticulosa]|nr:hypothetical protein GGS26DRAFT_586667 [Hypomontagnella submonticulosa]